MLNEVCKVSDRENGDFVGLRFDAGFPSVTFPRGFTLPASEKQLRRDVLRLLSTIGKFSDHREGDRVSNRAGEKFLNFPILSYQFLIYDFLAHGYYTENEVRYVDAKKGKINWKRTVQKHNAQIDGGNAVYLDFVVKTSKINSNNLISKIHQYCVYDSFVKLGWLYLSTDILPPKPNIQLNSQLFIATLRQAIGNTFNEQKRRLFQSMINILAYVRDAADENCSEAYGVERFEHVWEGMVDYVFGDDNKKLYFPRARWHVISGRSYESESSKLRPDTVVRVDDEIFILDAKYYKFGITLDQDHLPATGSIQKQITYGEYVDRLGLVGSDKIYNAFLLPFNCEGGDPYRVVSIATADWKRYSAQSPNYEYVLGVLIDTTYLLRTYAKHNMDEIEALTNLIEKTLLDYRTQSQVPRRRLKAPLSTRPL